MTTLFINRDISRSLAINQAAAVDRSDFAPGSWDRSRLSQVFAHSPPRPSWVPFESRFRISRTDFFDCEPG